MAGLGGRGKGGGSGERKRKRERMADPCLVPSKSTLWIIDPQNYSLHPQAIGNGVGSCAFAFASTLASRSWLGDFL